MAFPIEEQLRIIRKNTVDLLPEEELIRKLKRGTPLRVKYGADPTRPDLHLGHYVCLRKLKDFQDLGHRVIFIVGDFTAMIGDPSERSETRPRLSEEEVKENAQTYFEQVFKVLDPDRTEVVFNSKWLAPLTAKEVIELAATYTVARMLERDDFRKRFQEGNAIYIHEFLYPLFQGYDSVAIRADVEIGGTDQKFNFVVAREVQKAFGQEPQVILTLPLLEGTDGVRKMSKSYDNYIALLDPPKEMYGKVMSIPDELMPKYYRLVLWYEGEALKAVERMIREQPRDAKAKLAYEIVKLFHSEAAAREAEEEFNRVFREKQAPSEMPEFMLPPEGLPLLEILHRSGLVPSRSEGRRLIRQGAVRLEGFPITEETARIQVHSPAVLRVGKRRFLKLIPQAG